MWWCAVRAAAVALACGVLWSAGPAQAALVLTGPDEVAPGASFEVTLSLDEALTLNEPEVLDMLDIVVAYDPSVLSFVAPPTAGALLAGPDVSPSLDEISFALFLNGPTSFGPGELVRYRFDVLPGVQDATTLVVVNAAPTVLIDLEGNRRTLTDWAPATHLVQVVPEPSSWALLAAGLGCLIFVSMRGSRAVRAPGRSR